MTLCKCERFSRNIFKKMVLKVVSEYLTVTSFRLDLSLDENGNTSSTPVSHSTPHKTKRREYTCPYCDKKYVVKLYYDKHVAAHLSSGDYCLQFAGYGTCLCCLSG